MLQSIRRALNSQFARDEFVIGKLKALPAGSKLLDAGSGSQRYREHCSHLDYRAQDFAQFKGDEKTGFTTLPGYAYGKLDYTGDIWRIDERAGYFDAILCTEVFEHIPYPIETVREFARLLRGGGLLVLTAPSNCLRHMDPFFFYSGFSDRFYSKVLTESGFAITHLEPVGDYYKWLALEVARTARDHSFVAKLALAPALAYYLLKRRTEASANTLCMGYHVVARKL